MRPIDPIALLERALAESLPGCRFEPRDVPLNSDSELILCYPPSKYAFRFGNVTAPRIADVLGFLAVSILERPAWCSTKRLSPFLVMIAPRFGAKMILAAHEFVARHADDLSWMLITPLGAHHIELRWKNRLVILDGAAEKTAQPQRATNRLRTNRTRTIFSDLNRWMLKLLLLRDAPTTFDVPFRGGIANPTQLGSVARVSTETAHQFVRLFSERDFLRLKNGDIELVRKKDLLDSLLDEERRDSPVWTYARSEDSGPLELERLLASRSAGRIALGGFEACRRYGLLHTVPGVPLVLTEGPFDALLAEQFLRSAGSNEAQVAFTVPRYRESVFRGVADIGGVPLVDPLQASLDVAPVLGRGLEQAEFVVAEILSWSSR